jgi:hypothetical protein
MVTGRVGPVTVAAGALAVCASVIANAQAPARVPQYVWSIRSHSDTVFRIPRGPAADAGAGRVYVADVFGKRIAVLDGRSGQLLGWVGREGDGPGELRGPELVAVGQPGRLLVVLDAGKLEVFDSSGAPLRRVPYSPTVYFAKGLALVGDSAVALGGGVRAPDGSVPGAHWLRLGSEELTSSAPFVPEANATAREQPRDPRVYMAGGPVAILGAETVIADAATGDVWRIAPGRAELLAHGPGAPPDLMSRMIITETNHGRREVRPWWRFPRAVFIDSLKNGYVVGMSDMDGNAVRFYQVMPGRAPRKVGEWFAQVEFIGAYDATTCIVVGSDGAGGYVVGRALYPFDR